MASSLALWAQLLLLVLGPVASASPVAVDSAQQALQPPEPQFRPRKLNGKFLHITDFHPDPFYKVHSSTKSGIACHRRTGVAGTYGAETTRCDSPFALVNATFDWLAENIKDDIDFVVWTGDSARHDSDEKHPRTAAEVLDTNQMMADKFIETFSSDQQSLDVPVIPTLGNNDFLPHNIFYPGPNKWTRKFSEIWHRFIPEVQRHSFTHGGWFWVEVIPDQLAVFSLNTMYFFDRNAGVDGCANPSEPGYEHMDWLRVQLQLLRERGMKAILIGHVPPARTSGKQNWDETCWQKYTLWMRKYRDVVIGSIYGHMNIDHFLLQDTKKIDITLGAGELSARDALEEGTEFSTLSREDYLQELREEWSDLPGSALKPLIGSGAGAAEADASGKKRKKKKDKYTKIGGEYAERYALSLVSPSIVPNYFPTVRVIEYNITGLEDAALWTDSFDGAEPAILDLDNWEDEEEDSSEDQLQELKRHIGAEGKKGKNKKKGKKGKGKKPKKPKDPNFVVPKDPPKGSTPGPAYYPQPFTFTGYTQYFANLTYINNDISAPPDLAESRWRDRDHSDEEPKHSALKPREFKFEVEYSTFDDEVYKLEDMTVMSYLKLAYKMSLEEDPDKGKDKGKGKALEEEDEPGAADDEDEDVADVESQKKKKKKVKNQIWLHFLRNAFVRTVPEDELRKMA
ncbi:Endopolyphosphatase-like protein [Hapsidospora chrysogenum ATCC 11550]|uniref:Endopolyphosphatase n=1 Tax=Hapsidospora chrysogenum (strain ATCC 11550 / CBS 779.69 / DSM 880 / IAM 14645 / JCM 23072 / IMI 49137) TaxID=857340 RepID=A0A086SVQ0_HAPC1|nr:Endopolyphosphatase-like protein [Hapsidospora chrysogenum ATCC 11550]